MSIYSNSAAGLQGAEQVKAFWGRFLPAENDNMSQPKPSPLIEIFTHEDIYAEPDPVWLVKDILPENGFGVVVGAPGSKKSFIVQDLGSSVALGLPWLGQEVSKGDVVYIYAEGRKGLKPRLQAWEKHHGKRPKRMVIIDRAINIPDKLAIKQLVRSIRAKGINPKLIIIDTLARNFGDGDESKTPDMSAFVRGADTLRETFPECAVLVVHHTGWDGKHERGSSSLRGAEDVNIKVVSKANSKTGTISFEKIKDGDPEQFGTIKFELVQVGKSAVVHWRPSLDPDDVPTKQAPVTPKLTPTQREILLQFRSPNSKYRNGELQKATGVSPSTLSAALKVLTSQGYIAKADDGKGYVLLSKTTPISKRKSK